MGSYLSHTTPRRVVVDVQDPELNPNEFPDDEAFSIIDSLNYSKNRLGYNPGEYFHAPVWHISPNTVLKRTQSWPCETYTMMVVASSTSIPVPKVRKCVFRKGDVWTFMEYVDGPTLAEAWPTLSIWMKLWVAWKVRSYISQLRRLTPSLPVPHIPGPKDGTENPRRCEGHFFTDIGTGPFSSYDELSAWYSKKADLAVYLHCERSAYLGEAPSLSREKLHFDDSVPLVLTHGDISLRNLILGKDGRLWLIDWGFSGVYPQWLEYASMMAHSYKRGPEPKLWFWLTPFMAGWYNPQFLYLRSIGAALMSYN
ncbi:kinase-like protein [Neolentinus lepideus HHB14362 ss-1]|uniref:Kinase-like protein n=1 Tax=Neolentinus lepideus HHB14362 ss-1 TaxID=1314782 RepID=A0A165SLT7_9AGAM|nr:kinase-like protein [Neolentinus lepideus HHB14362 ss-1]